MKWGILATGTIAKKFASTVEQMGAEGQHLSAGFPARRDHDAGSGGQRAGDHPLPGGHQRL